MRHKLLFMFLCDLFFFVEFSFSQGGFLGQNNAQSLTRIGAMDGMRAGTNILGQFLAGATVSSLTPVGDPLTHVNGAVAGDRIVVPTIDGGNPAWVQLVAWDRSLWGESLQAVPLDQLGRTDIVSVSLTFSFQPYFAPPFSQGAIVPVPEPALSVLALTGACCLIVASKRSRKAHLEKSPD